MPITRKTGEIHFHTSEQVGGYVLQALEIAATTELSPEDRAVLLPQIMVMLGQKQVMMEQVNAVDAFGVIGGRG